MSIIWLIVQSVLSVVGVGIVSILSVNVSLQGVGCVSILGSILKVRSVGDVSILSVHVRLIDVTIWLIVPRFLSVSGVSVLSRALILYNSFF